MDGPYFRWKIFFSCLYSSTYHICFLLILRQPLPSYQRNILFSILPRKHQFLNFSLHNRWILFITRQELILITSQTMTVFLFPPPLFRFLPIQLLSSFPTHYGRLHFFADNSLLILLWKLLFFVFPQAVFYFLSRQRPFLNSPQTMFSPQTANVFISPQTITFPISLQVIDVFYII